MRTFEIRVSDSTLTLIDAERVATRTDPPEVRFVIGDQVIAAFREWVYWRLLPDDPKDLEASAEPK